MVYARLGLIPVEWNGSEIRGAFLEYGSVETIELMKNLRLSCECISVYDKGVYSEADEEIPTSDLGP